MYLYLLLENKNFCKIFKFKNTSNILYEYIYTKCKLYCYWLIIKKIC